MNNATSMSPLGHERISMLKHIIIDSRDPEKYNYTMMKYGSTFYSLYA